MDVLEMSHDLQPSSLGRDVFLPRIRHAKQRAVVGWIVDRRAATRRDRIIDVQITYFRKNLNMRGNSLCLLLLLAILTKAYVKSCKYWCRMGNHQYYCCPNGKGDSSSEHSWHSFLFPWLWLGIAAEPHVEQSWHEHVMKWKPKKHCPPLRTHCPRTYEWKPPKHCDNDHECDQWEKCCYDVCLEHKTCKDAE